MKIQVIYNRKQKYYSTGQELSKEDWANLAESKSRRLSEIRSSVENSFSIIKSQVESLAERGEFGFDLLSIRLGRCTTVTVNAAVRAIHKSGVIAEHSQHCEVIPDTYWATLYNMDMIASLAFRINSYGAEKIRGELFKRICGRKEKVCYLFSFANVTSGMA